ncbi:MAG: patatin-like phospholipase family protein [Clostridia bacterium]|nr:patatin-like phospholipase family protein [Clostridia bacterium]
MGLFSRKKKDGLHKKVKVGFALGGGGVRGIGHIGAIRALEELGVTPKFICGTSVGSIVGALISFGLSTEEIEDLTLSLKRSDIKKKNWFFRPSSSENLEETLIKIFKKDLVFSELKIPFQAIAVDLKTGKEVRLDSGSVAKACASSSAVPMVFKPVVYDGMHLVDGGLANNVPADAVREMGANVVIAIDVNPNRGKGTESLKLISVLSKTVGLMMQNTINTKLKCADIVIVPPLGEYSSSKLGGTDEIKEMIQIGYDAVMEHKDEILKLVRKKPKKKDKIVWHLNVQKRKQ